MLRRRLALLLVLLISSQCFGQTGVNGSWSTLETWPFRAVHAILLPNGKVLFWSYYDESLTPQIWDPVSDTVSAAAASSYRLFCAGHSTLADGRVLVTGGHQADYVGLPNASIYDPFNNTWTNVPNMNAGRWYPTNTTLPNGDVLVISGDIDSNTNVDTLPQVYQVATNSWRNLASAQLALPLYPRMFVAPNGLVFDAGPDPNTRYLDTSGAGSWTSVATTNFGLSRDYGSAVMYTPGKFVTMGGGDPPTATAETIDLNSATPTWQNTGSMAFARRQMNATVLPDGTILVTGGSSGAGFDNNNAPVETSEIWNPATRTFTQVAAESTYRGYHSIAILLPDGRVLSAGGNVAGPTAQVYSPPYLFQGARPTITSAPGYMSYGSTFTVNTSQATAITSVSLIRTGAVTHAFNMDQRFMQLSFTATSGGLNVTAPSSANIAPPGYYMLFVLTNGVPSVAAIVQLGKATPTTGMIQGQVMSSSGGPLSGATVSYGGGSARTDAGGNYLLAGAPAGSVFLTASDSGFNNNSVQVTVTAGATVKAPTITLTPIPPGTSQSTVSLSSSSPSATVKAGQSAAYTIAVTPQGGPYNNDLVFACSGLPNLSSCTFSPPSVTPGASAVNLTLTISTTASSVVVASTSGNPSLPYLGLTSFAVLGMICLRRPRISGSRFLLQVGLIALIALCAGCGGGSANTNTHTGSESSSTAQAGTTPGTYTVSVVSSSSGQAVASTSVGLTVQ